MIDFGCAPFEIVLGRSELGLRVAGRRAFQARNGRLHTPIVIKRGRIGILIVETCIEHLAILRADRQEFPVLNRFKVNIVPQDVPFNRLKERLSATLKPLEKVSPAETDESLSTAGEIR